MFLELLITGLEFKLRPSPLNVCQSSLVLQVVGPRDLEQLKTMPEKLLRYVGWMGLGFRV